MTVSDVTKQKRAEQALRELNESLERRVAERTAELEQRTALLQRLALELSCAEERERERIAKILHDGVQQNLVAIKSLLAGLLPAPVEGSITGRSTSIKK